MSDRYKRKLAEERAQKIKKLSQQLAEKEQEMHRIKQLRKSDNINALFNEQLRHKASIKDPKIEISALEQENQQLRQALEEHYELSKRLMDYKGLKDTGIIMRTEQVLNAKNESNSQNT